MNWDWGWIVDPPPQFGDNLFFDIWRMVVVALLVLTVVMTMRVLLEQRRRAVQFNAGQRARFIGSAMALASVGFTEIAVFGTPATIRLIWNTVAVAFALYGAWEMRQEQHRDPVVHP